MSTIDDALSTQIRNIEEKTGKPISEWIAIAKNSGKSKHTEIIAMLKNDYGLTHGNANRIALMAREADAASIVKSAKTAGTDPVDEMYGGKKAELKPVHEALLAAINEFGKDIEVAPKNGYVSLRRKKQFAMIQPTTATRIDVGLMLKDMPTTDRLESAAGFNAMFTHRVRLSKLDEVDQQLVVWLKQAYDKAG